MKFYLAPFLISLPLLTHFAWADDLSQITKKTLEASIIIEEVVSIPDHAIPTSLLEKSTCIATIPNVIRAGFVFGARYGKGLVACRVPGGWSRPSVTQIRGGSWGLQFGIQSIDLVLVFTRPNAVEKFSKNNFTVGVDATVAAGPLGRDAQAGTDYKLDSEIYSYSRAKGLFAGLTIEGTAVTVDRKDNTLIYGITEAGELLAQDGKTAPASVVPYVDALIRFAK